MKNFDDVFAEKVREVFDSYHEPCPEGAWEAFSEKMNRRKKKVFLFPPLAWAAGLALLLSVSALLWFYPNDNQQLAQTSQSESNNQNVESSLGAEDIPNPSETIVQPTESEALVSLPSAKPAVLAKSPGKSLLSIDEKTLQHTQPPTALVTKENMEASENILPQLTSNKEIAEQSLTHQEIMTIEKEITETKQTEDIAEKPGLVIPDDFLKNQNQWAYEVSTDAAVKSESGFDFGMTVSSMMAFSEGSVSNKPGISGGVLSGFRLNNLLGIASGLIVSRHNYQFQGFMAFKNEDMATDDFQVSHSYERQSDNDFDIVALDIPLNITFHTGSEPGKGFYFTTGVSSFVYLQEKYSYERTLVNNTVVYSPETGQLSNQYSVERSQVNESYEPLSRFDFARQWNFSLGYLFRFSHGSLAIEPYIKIPIGELTHQRIRLGHGGIGLVYKPQLSANKK